MGPAPEIAAVRTAVRDCLAAGSGRFFVACSGGADSVALAAAAAFAAPRLGVRVGLITVDHGVQAGSADRAAEVAALGWELGLEPVHTVRVEVGTDGGPEAAARIARYAALDRAASAADARLLLGHTLDDQAESVLLGLGRGSGPRSVAGMAEQDGHRVRPFLGLRRATTRAACDALGLPVWDDPHNTDPAFQRARLRHEVLPLLEDVLQGGVAEALARTADLFREDVVALDAWAASALPTAAGGANIDRPGLDTGALAELPRAVRTRVLRLWAAQEGAGPLSAERTDALDALVSDWHGQGPIDLPGGVAVHRASGRLEIVPLSPPPQENRV